jgi:hypothetical protein
MPSGEEATRRWMTIREFWPKNLIDHLLLVFISREREDGKMNSTSTRGDLRCGEMAQKTMADYVSQRSRQTL